MKSREGCCADTRKPCSYHEGREDEAEHMVGLLNDTRKQRDAAVAKGMEWMDAYDEMRTQRDALTQALRPFYVHNPCVQCPPGKCLPTFLVVRALAALDKPKFMQADEHLGWWTL